VLDFDSLQDLLQNIATGDVSLDGIGTDGFALEGLTLDHLSDALTSAGIDLSQLSEADITSLLSVVDSTSVELPSGMTIENTKTTQFGVGGPSLFAALTAAAEYVRKVNRAKKQ
jgi:hypothetical protein